jgi:hypothetical protein
MSFTTIWDDVQKIGALVDAEFGRALGPIATGEKAVELLEKFAGSHGVDPATIPAGELEARWKQFVSALSTGVAEVDGKPVTAGDVAVTPPAASLAAVPEQAPVDPTAAAEKAPAEPATPLAAGHPAAGAPAVDVTPAPTDVVKPVTVPRPGYAVCPTCSGWGEVVDGGVTKPCPTCAGTGEVIIDQHPGAAPSGK